MEDLEEEEGGGELVREGELELERGETGYHASPAPHVSPDLHVALAAYAGRLPAVY